MQRHNQFSQNRKHIYIFPCDIFGASTTIYLYGAREGINEKWKVCAGEDLYIIFNVLCTKRNTENKKKTKNIYWFLDEVEY